MQAKRVAIYTRVSTDRQTTENQRLELLGVAEKHGWQIVAEFADEGISGSKGRDKRPAFDRLLKGATRREFDMVMAWSVDRLGRSLQHLVAFLAEIQAAGVGLYLHQQGLDTSTPAGEALFGMMGVFAQFERSMIIERTKSGLARARAAGKKFGRPKLALDVVAKVNQALAAGEGTRAIARRLGISTGSVVNVKRAQQAA
jgi:DNA invertase Pin-like site-specific DNA recombinase